MKNRTKIITIIICFIFLYIFAMLISQNYIKTLKNNIELITNNCFTSLDLLKNANKNFYQMRDAEKACLISYNNKETIRYYISIWNDNSNQSKELISQYFSLITNQEEKDEYLQFTKHYETWQNNSKYIIQNSYSFDQKMRQTILNMSLEETKNNFDSMQNSIAVLQGIIKNRAKTIYSESKYVGTDIFASLDLILLLALILIIFVTVKTIITINKSMNTCINIGKHIAIGDLNIQIDNRFLSQNDENGDLIRNMNTTIVFLNEVISEIKNIYISTASKTETLSLATNKMFESISELTDSIHNIYNGAYEQIDNTNILFSDLEKIENKICFSSQSITEEQEVSSKFLEQARQNFEATKNTIQILKTISEKFLDLEDLTNEINMVSLNANIEAAKAGIHGKGFSVVATEIGKLAESSKESVIEINELASNSLEISTKASTSLSSLIPKIENNLLLIQKTFKSLNEQGTLTKQASLSIENLETITKQNIKTSKSFSNISDDIKQQALQIKLITENLSKYTEEMKQLIAKFNTDSKLSLLGEN